MSTPLLENILNQAEALKAVSAFHFGAGAEALQRAAQQIRVSKKVVLSGMGASCFACMPLQYMLAGSGIDVSLMETAELLYFPAPYFNSDTTFLLVSRSGESIEVTKLFEPLNACGARAIGITNVAESTLSKRADESLLLHSPADQLVAIQTYSATLAVLSLLQAAVVQEQAELTTTIQLLEANLASWVDSRRDWHDFLHSPLPLYILGRGSSLGAVAEGVLLMHETAKAPAVGMSAPQFRHGPVEVVDKNFRAIIVGTQPETAELDARLANDLLAMGGQVRWIGPKLSSLRAEPLIPWPADVPARFTAILETIPLQIVAYTKAELRGIRPGDFRWAPAITSTEAGFLI